MRGYINELAVNGGCMVRIPCLALKKSTLQGARLFALCVLEWPGLRNAVNRVKETLTRASRGELLISFEAMRCINKDAWQRAAVLCK